MGFTCQCCFCDDFKHLLLDDGVVTELLPQTFDTLPLSQRQQLLLIGHHKANHVRLVTGRQEEAGLQLFVGVFRRVDYKCVMLGVDDMTKCLFHEYFISR